MIIDIIYGNIVMLDYSSSGTAHKREVLLTIVLVVCALAASVTLEWS